MKKATVFIIEDGLTMMEEMTKLDRDELIDIDNNELVEITSNKILSSHDEILEYIERGDIVQFEKECYRNDFKLIWDGKKLINLEFDVDEYGNLPKQFTMDEFSVDYWDKAIAHNYIRWPTDNITDQIRENFSFNTQTENGWDGCWYSFFIINGVSKYIVRPESEECKPHIFQLTKDDYWIDSKDHICGLENHVIFNSF